MTVHGTQGPPSQGHGLINRAEFITQIARQFWPTMTSNKKISYYNIAAAYDIEVSSFYDGANKRAVMYVWTFGIGPYVTYGRTWDEYSQFINALEAVMSLDSDNRLVVYVHNLAYEFQFMRKRFNWDKVFLLEERKPVYAISGGIEYRCSLKLSGGKSLEKIGEDLHSHDVKKLVGNLDYQLIRTPKTHLYDEELAYSEYDVRVVIAYIEEKIVDDGGICNIPMTNTGYVRNYCRKACFTRYKRYRGLMSVLTLDADEYSQLKRAFQGGFVHANASYTGEILKDVGSFDFTSSYPSVMVSEKFPMGKCSTVSSFQSFADFDYYLDNYCCLFDLMVTNIRPKLTNDHPLSRSKTWYCKGDVTDNGRIVYADSLWTTCTEQDYRIYSQFYDWDEETISNFRYYPKGYLPKDFVKSILDLYVKKTSLKDVEGEEVNYMISKNMLNSAYGMSVTDIVRNELDYVNNEFSKTKPDTVAAIEKYNKGKKRFLFYPWGVWVTAYARRNLFTGIAACGDDYVYSDTDSIKILNPYSHMDYIERYNAEIRSKLERAAEFQKLDLSLFSPVNKKGVEKPLGVWSFEGVYNEFKTLGAKRYMVREGDKYTLTMAGLNKKTAMDYIKKTNKNPFNGLKDGMEIPEEYSGRLTHTYIDEPYSGTVVDYLGVESDYTELSGIHMEPSKYDAMLSPEYRDYINYIFNRKELLS